MNKAIRLGFLKALKKKIGNCKFDKPITFIARGEYDSLVWAIRRLSLNSNKEKVVYKDDKR